VFSRSLCRIKFGDRTQVLDANFFNAPTLLVLQHFPAAPAFFDRARDGSINRDEIPLHIHNRSIPLDVEGTPAARVIRTIHSDSIDPILVTDPPHDHCIAWPEVPGRRHFESACADRDVIVRDSLLCFLLQRDAGRAAGDHESPLIATSTTRAAGTRGAAPTRSDEDKGGGDAGFP